MNQTYLNSPVKNCRTCAHCSRDNMGSRFDHCMRYGHYCSTSILFDDLCGTELVGWKQSPPPPPPKPRRSLRQWIYDLLWRRDHL